MQAMDCWDGSPGLFGDLLGGFRGFLKGSSCLLGGCGSPRRHLWGGCFRASEGHFWGSWGPSGSLVRLFRGLLEPPGGFLGQEVGIAGLRSLSWAIFQAILGLPWAALGLSKAVLGPHWPVLGPSWGSHGRSFSCLGTVLGVSWAVLELSWGPLRPSWSVGSSKTRESQKPRKKQ